MLKMCLIAAFGLSLVGCGLMDDDDNDGPANAVPVLSHQSTKLSINLDKDAPGAIDPKSRSLQMWTAPIAVSGKSGAVIYFRIAPSLFEHCYMTEEHKTEKSSVFVPKMELHAYFAMQADQFYDSNKHFPISDRPSGIIEIPTLPGNYMTLVLTGGTDDRQISTPRNGTSDEPEPEDKTPFCKGSIDFEVTAK